MIVTFCYSLNPMRPGDLKEAYNVCELQDETQVFDITETLNIIT